MFSACLLEAEMHQVFQVNEFWKSDNNISNLDV